MSEPLLRVRGLVKHFPGRGGLLGLSRAPIRAVDGVSFDIARGEVVGLVGESGSGKSTIGRAILRLIEPTAGEVRLDGADITQIGRSAMRRLRRRLQIIFQDPYASLDPRKSVEAIIGDSLDIHALAQGAERRRRIEALMSEVGLAPEHLARYPHQFSGGQRQRISIARALAVEPDLIVADEPVSALDVSVQAQIVNLLADLRRRLGLTMLFISHDLSVVEHLSDRVIVLYLGRIMEMGPARRIYGAPRHPYTRALLSATPVPDPAVRRSRIILQGELPSPANPPSGCVFHTRCPYAVEACKQTVPTLEDMGEGHQVACIRQGELAARV